MLSPIAVPVLVLAFGVVFQHTSTTTAAPEWPKHVVEWFPWLLLPLGLRAAGLLPLGVEMANHPERLDGCALAFVRRWGYGLDVRNQHLAVTEPPNVALQRIPVVPRCFTGSSRPSSAGRFAELWC